MSWIGRLHQAGCPPSWSASSLPYRALTWTSSHRRLRQDRIEPEAHNCHRRLGLLVVVGHDIGAALPSLLAHLTEDLAQEHEDAAGRERFKHRLEMLLGHLGLHRGDLRAYVLFARPRSPGC